ncbi:StAR-related lipid transfer protein 7, mitochondrial [Halotydeus destructor]|nr:StAR-related lipid transfer protein 7, mitochondrial [Halotydeus destructor]
MSARDIVTHRLSQYVTRNWPRIQDAFRDEIRSSCQLITMYRKLMSNRNLFASRLINEMKSRLIAFRGSAKGSQELGRRRTFRFVLGASGVAFWEKEGVTKVEIKQTIEEFWRAFKASGGQIGPPGSGSRGNGCKFDSESDSGDDKDEEDETCQTRLDDWEPIIVQDHFQVWRQAVPNSYLYRYKIFGTFDDVPAKAFFAVQMDTEYRKSWDKLVIKLDVVDREMKNAPRDYNSVSYYDSHNEVVHWVMNYPFPLYGRDYCYIRRAIIDHRKNLMVMVSRAVEHPSCPETPKVVRVRTYESNMVIKPHKSFDENGFDYLLTYFDDPKAAFPSMAYNWMACSGVPDFVKQLHAAAYELTVRNKLMATKAAAKSNSQSNASSNSNYVYA